MLFISIKSRRYNCYLDIKHRISIITGDSGVGKTLLVKALMDESGGYCVNFSSPVTTVKLHSNIWDTQLNYNSKSTYLFIADDSDFVYTKEFSNTIGTINNHYLLIICRSMICKSEMDKYCTLHVDKSAIYKLVAYGINHYVIPYY